MNSVQLVGNISTEINIRYTPQGHAVASFNLAVTNPFNREKTSFIPVEVWRKTAENLSQYCDKGSKIGVVGTIEVENYEKDGQKRTFTKVSAQYVEFLNAKNKSDTGNNSVNPDKLMDDLGGVEVTDDSLPF